MSLAIHRHLEIKKSVLNNNNNVTKQKVLANRTMDIRSEKSNNMKWQSFPSC